MLAERACDCRANCAGQLLNQRTPTEKQVFALASFFIHAMRACSRRFHSRRAAALRWSRGDLHRLRCRQQALLHSQFDDCASTSEPASLSRRTLILTGLLMAQAGGTAVSAPAAKASLVQFPASSLKNNYFLVS